jgi:hypothetical protein
MIIVVVVVLLQASSYRRSRKLRKHLNYLMPMAQELKLSVACVSNKPVVIFFWFVGFFCYVVRAPLMRKRWMLPWGMNMLSHLVSCFCPKTIVTEKVLQQGIWFQDDRRGTFCALLCTCVVLFFYLLCFRMPFFLWMYGWMLHHSTVFVRTLQFWFSQNNLMEFIIFRLNWFS